MSDKFYGGDVRISLPEDVKLIIRTINEAGYEAYAVGGCVRDRLLGKEPNDYDITTSATPEEIKALFRRTIDTGIQHGTVTIMLKDTGYEVTTYRIDGKYEDNRHPSSVSFTRSLREDLLRRDFTINAMAYNDDEGLVDLFGGQQDMEDKIIRCVGDPIKRFSEDALRIMRAVRFSAQLGYEIEPETLKAMSALASNLKDISMERIQVELVKLICSPHPEHIKIAYEQGLTKVFMPEFDSMMETSQNHPHHMYSVGGHTIKTMEVSPPIRELRLSMLFHDSGKPQVKTTDEEGIDHFHGHNEVSKHIANEVLHRLKFDNYTIKLVKDMSYYHDIKIEGNHRAVRRAINKIGIDEFKLLLMVKEADVLGQSDYKRSEKLEEVDTLRKLYQDILEKNECLGLKDLKIDGKILMDMGYPKGPELGIELNKLLDRVLEDPSINDEVILSDLARKDLDEIKCI